MNVLLFIAGLLSILLGLAHSFLGERLIFSGWRKTPPDIPRRHYNIIWASWHLVSLLGFGIGGAFMWLSHHHELIGDIRPIFISLITALILSGILVFYATRGKHPGWIVLLIIAALTVFGIKS